MKTLFYTSVLLTIGLVFGKPFQEKRETRIDNGFYNSKYRIYTSPYNIVKIHVPVNSLNFNSKDHSVDLINVFIVEVDEDVNKTINKGISLLINGETKLILENGVDSTSAGDITNQVFFAATDGIYLYNNEEQTAEKYGNIDDSIISIAKSNNSDAIYIVNSKNEAYKVTKDGTVKEKLDNIKDASQIMLDSNDNIYYVDNSQHLYVLSEGILRKVEGLPENSSNIELLRPPFIFKDGVPVIANDKAYLVYHNGSSVLSQIVFDKKPTAYSMEATLIQYYAYDKSVYRFNILEMFLNSIMEQIRESFGGKLSKHRSSGKNRLG